MNETSEMKYQLKRKKKKKKNMKNQKMKNPLSSANFFQK